jgi:hypothetical protein
MTAPHPHLTFDFSQLWIALLILGAGAVVLWWLGRRKK